MAAGSMFVDSSVHPVTKYMIMYCEQMTGPRSANFSTHVKVPLPGNFQPNP